MRIATANFYVGNTQPRKDAEQLRSLGVDVACIQESHSHNTNAIRDALKNDYRVYVGGNTIQEQDSPILIHKKFKVKKFWNRQISKRAQVKNIGMPRTASVIRFDNNDKKWCVINTHTNAAVQNRNTGAPLSTKIKRVAEYVAGMIVLETMIRNALRRDDFVVVTGDLNYRVVKTGVWKFSPQGLFSRTKLKFVNRGLDYVAYSSNLEVDNLKVIPPVKGGHDHPWLIVDLEAKK